jgi:hypothetical protein
MIIKMLEDATASYDGVNHKMYLKDGIYNIEFPNERNLFPILVSSGKAEFYDPARPNKEIKIVTPKARKTRQK